MFVELLPDHLGQKTDPGTGGQRPVRSTATGALVGGGRSAYHFMPQGPRADAKLTPARLAASVTHPSPPCYPVWPVTAGGGRRTRRQPPRLLDRDGGRRVGGDDPQAARGGGY